jgi:glycosidase
MKRELLNSTIYSIFVRNYSEDGTFARVQDDLGRIKSLGAEIIWLMPIHPIGTVARKGALGSPYAISDYRGINPEYGTLEDFRRLVQRAHELGLKVMIDVVYNHTSPDSLLFAQHPDWFYRNADGSPGNRIGDWSDIIDLDFSNSDLREYLIESLKYWLEQGVDGFRCDVAPLIPLDFWIDARKACESVKPDIIWLTESVEPTFIEELRSRGFFCHSDGEMYRAFDIAYDYDTYFAMHQYRAGAISLEQYLDLKRIQIYSLPGEAIKLRYIENHDTPRGAQWFPELRALRNYTAFSFFERGCSLVYNGQEVGESNRTSLFDRDPVDWQGNPEHVGFIQSCIAMKKSPVMRDGWYELPRGPVRGLALAAYRDVADSARKRYRRIGIFNIEGKTGELNLGDYLPELAGLDGEFANVLNYSGAAASLSIFSGKIAIPSEPLVIDLP